MTDERRQFTDQRYVHFMTFSVYRRRRLLDWDRPKRIVLGVLNQLLESKPASCVGFVIMPDHVHALVWLDDSWQLIRFIHSWKRMSSYRIRAWYAEQGDQYFEGFGRGEKFWQPKYHAFQVHSRRKLEEKLQYMHLNPVRAELVPQAINWPWSSARWYLEGRSVGVPISWIDC